MNIIVAGGAGFIGSHLCDDLIEKGHHVIAIDSCVTGKRENINHLTSCDRFDFFEHDIRNCLDDNLDLMKKIENLNINQIYNLASPASPKDFDTKSVLIMETGSLGHKNLLDLSIKLKARILLASTSEVYGDAEIHPQPETYFGNVNTFGARSCYDEAKRYAEALTYSYKKEKKADARVARIFNTYGPRMNANDGRIIPNFFCQALTKNPLSIYGDGTQTRSFCYVKDMVEGLQALMNSDVDTPVNIGNPIERTVLEMANIINSLTENSSQNDYLPLPENDPKQRRPNIDRAKELLNWEPQIGLEEGLDKTYMYFKSVAHEYK